MWCIYAFYTVLKCCVSLQSCWFVLCSGVQRYGDNRHGDLSYFCFWLGFIFRFKYSVMHDPKLVRHVTTCTFGLWGYKCLSCRSIKKKKKEYIFRKKSIHYMVHILFMWNKVLIKEKNCLTSYVCSQIETEIFYKMFMLIIVMFNSPTYFKESILLFMYSYRLSWDLSTFAVRL